jgi:DNA replication and repair protein RecF
VRLDWLELTDFRSYTELAFKPEPTINVLVGDNGAGKTNLLEAIAYLGSLSSFRGAPETALVASGATKAVVRGEVNQMGSTSLVEIELPTEGRRRVQVNRQHLTRVGDMLGHLRIVVFLPDDLDIVKRGPSYRRDFLDAVCVQLWPVAFLDQQEYERALRQRNALLRQMGRSTDPATLNVWNQRLSEAGAKVMIRRYEAVAAISEHTKTAYRALTTEPSRIQIGYRSNWGGSVVDQLPVEDLTARLWAALEEAETTDKDRRVTTVGPHRDEPLLFINGQPTRTHASQGEQRTLILSLRLASHAAISERVGSPPLLILDDVFSELDIGRARSLAAALPNAQTFITTARDEEVPLKGARWEAISGGVKRAVST